MLVKANRAKNEFIKKNNIDEIFVHYSEIRNTGVRTLLGII